MSKRRAVQSDELREITPDELRKITPDALVGDRVLQRNIHYTLASGRDFDYSVMLRRSGSSFSEDMAFVIADENHIYFFTRRWPGREFPEYLGRRDVIGSGLEMLEEGMRTGVFIPFNKPLSRVGRAGELPCRYNSRTAVWKPYGDHVYSPVA